MLRAIYFIKNKLKCLKIKRFIATVRTSNTQVKKLLQNMLFLQRKKIIKGIISENFIIELFLLLFFDVVKKTIVNLDAVY